ncbi:MAG TPA: adenosine deaminase [Actinomycetota bacterium]|nr:adenosine deaminase [Actinomycetota bacterium]
MRDLVALPKAELHVHLEGSIRPETVRELADREGISVPSGLSDGGWRFAGFDDFIDQYTTTCALLSGPEDFRRLAYEFCQDEARTGVAYAEVVFSPSNHAPRLGDDWFGPIEAVLDGLESGRRDFGVTARVAPDLVRDAGLGMAERSLEVALKYAGRGVVALNAAGSERIGVEPFAPLFRRAKDAGLRSVPHAGEWAGPRNVWETLEHYLPDRIGHGVRAAEDPALVEHLAAIGIPLEVSPVSNVATGVYAGLAEHPFRRLRDAGVGVTLNSDDPPMFGAWLSDVYASARDTWAFTDEELAEIARTGVRASFADPDVARTILEGIDGWLAGPAPTGDGATRRPPSSGS